MRKLAEALFGDVLVDEVDVLLLVRVESRGDEHELRRKRANRRRDDPFRTHRPVCASSGSGAALSSAPRRTAASVTVRPIGPAVSWSSVIGMIPWRLIRPVVGRIPTSIVSAAGLTTDPAVSVPTFAAQKFAAVPAPELDPPVLSAGRPSLVASRGSGRGSYGLKANPPTAL